MQCCVLLEFSRTLEYQQCGKHEGCFIDRYGGNHEEGRTR